MCAKINKKQIGNRIDGTYFYYRSVVLGWVEVSTFIYIANKFGGLLTLLGVFLTAIIGIALLKNQGLYVLTRICSDVERGRAPVKSIADSVSLIFGGILMLIPGYMTDVIGLLLFIPGLRTITGVGILKWITNSSKFIRFVKISGGPFTGKTRANSGIDNNQTPFGFYQKYQQQEDAEDVIEGQFEELPDPKPDSTRKRVHHNPLN